VDSIDYLPDISPAPFTGTEYMTLTTANVAKRQNSNFERTSN